MCQSKAQGGRRCIRHHTGSRLALSVDRRFTPELDEEIRERLVTRLWREAKQSNMHKAPANPTEVESWMDYTRHLIQTLPMDETYRVYCQKRLDALEAEYLADPSIVTAGHLHVWKYLSGVSEQEVDRGVRQAPLTVALDLDGCLYPFGVMDDWMKARGYEQPAGPQETYSYSDYWGITHEQFFDEMAGAVKAGLLFRYGDPYQDGVALAREAYRQGHHVKIVTARNLPGVEDEARAATVRWLREQKVPFDSIDITHEKEKVAFDMLIDDHPGNVEKVTASGKRAVLLDRPWNRKEGHAGHERAGYSDMIQWLQEPEAGVSLF